MFFIYNFLQNLNYDVFFLFIKNAFCHVKNGTLNNYVYDFYLMLFSCPELNVCL